MPLANKKFPLQEWYVISLRPLHQHAGVRRAARARGATTFCLSTLYVSARDAGVALSLASQCPRVVVTSPAAVRFAAAQHSLEQQPGQRWFALGAGSAMALRRAGIAGALTPESGSDSEALLSMPELADVRGQRIGLLTAPGGRGVLLRELQARGAEVIVAEVYQRQLRAPGTARLRALAQLPPRSALLFTSLQAFEPLWQALDADSRQNLLRRPCVVASARLQSMAEGLGFIDVVRADGAEPKRLLDALGEHVAKRRFR